MTTVDSSFAARVNEVCDDLRLPTHGRQTALAQRMGLTPNAARKWLRGEGMPEMATAVKLAQLANVSVLWLLQGVLPKRPGHVEIRGLVIIEALNDLPPDARTPRCCATCASRWSRRSAPRRAPSASCARWRVMAVSGWAPPRRRPRAVRTSGCQAPEAGHVSGKRQKTSP